MKKKQENVSFETISVNLENPQTWKAEAFKAIFFPLSFFVDL